MRTTLLSAERRAEIASIAEQLEALADAYKRSAHQRRCLRVYNAATAGARALRELLDDALAAPPAFEKLLQTAIELEALEQSCLGSLPHRASHPIQPEA